jgi:TPR repeat protein
MTTKSEKLKAFSKICLDMKNTKVKKFMIERLKQMSDKDNNDSYAQNELGGLYYYGCDNIIEQDYKKAYKYYKLSADQGESEAQYNLGKLYYDGNFKSNIKKEYKYIEAYMWLKMSADQGNEKALRTIREMMEDQDIMISLLDTLLVYEKENIEMKKTIEEYEFMPPQEISNSSEERKSKD